jgi:hypothetical protein
MQLATTPTPFVNFRKQIADAMRDEPPMERREAVRLLLKADVSEAERSPVPTQRRVFC